MIVGNKVTKVEAARLKDEPRKGLSFKVNMRDVKIKGKQIEISYEYVAEYTEGIGYVKMEGVILAEEEKGVLDGIKKEWADNKRLPKDYMEIVLNAVTYFGGVNGVFVSRVVGLSPPIVPPRYTINEKAETKE